MPPEEAGQPNRRYRIARLVVLPADGVIGVFDERIDVVDGQAVSYTHLTLPTIA